MTITFSTLQARLAPPSKPGHWTLAIIQPSLGLECNALGRTSAAETPAMRKAAPKPIPKHDTGDERMQSSFAMYNGLRLINLSQRSKFGSVVKTMTIDEMLQEIGALTSVQ